MIRILTTGILAACLAVGLGAAAQQQPTFRGTADNVRVFTTVMDRDGRLVTLIPSLYGSRKTKLPHVPTASAGWDLAAGTSPLAEVLGGVERGALIGRLSMGNPAANGDFSGVIKNSFRIDDGTLGPALSETMISGNIGRMLRDVVALSQERIDTGALRLPWLRIANLHFS